MFVSMYPDYIKGTCVEERQSRNSDKSSGRFVISRLRVAATPRPFIMQKPKFQESSVATRYVDYIDPEN